MSKQQYGCQCLWSLMCTWTLMRVTAHRGCTHIARESVCTENWTVGGSPFLHWGIKSASTMCKSDALPTDLRPYLLFGLFWGTRHSFQLPHETRIIIIVMIIIIMKTCKAQIQLKTALNPVKNCTKCCTVIHYILTENKQEKILAHTIIELILTSNYISPSIWLI